MTLTEEMMHTIVAFIRAGAFDQSAAAAVGISPRTLRDWLERGEGRGSKSSNPLLDELAKQVGVARGQARVGAETRVYREDPKYWLTHAARSTKDEPGWTEPRSGTAGAQDLDADPLTAQQIFKLPQPELEQEYFRLIRPEAADGTFAMPPCPDPECPCPLHANYERRMEELGR